MNRLAVKLSIVIFMVVVFVGVSTEAHAVIADSVSISIIEPADILGFPDPAPSASGLGNLDLIMFSHAAGGADNKVKIGSVWHDYDNANTDLPSGAGSPSTVNESYITSIGDLRDFYNINFTDPLKPVNEIVLSFNINETGTPQTIELSVLDVIINYTIPTDNPAQPNDIASSVQNGINSTFDGGTRIARLGTEVTLDQLYTGTGRPDYSILTGINPFDAAYSDSDKFLVHWESNLHNNGGETVFVSGKYRKEDLINGNGTVIPEPATMSLLGIGLLGLLGFRKKA